MFYEIKDKLINLDKIIIIEKLINIEKKDFTLFIKFNNKHSEFIEFDSLIRLDLEYKQIKERLKEIYG